MHDAASANAVGAMEWLKAQGADVNAQTFYSDTPLHLAAKNGAVAAMNWLKVNGGLDDDFMFSYFTWLSPRDTYNSRGAPLNDVCAIVQQDRANVHKFGNPDRHTPDSFFHKHRASRDDRRKVRFRSKYLHCRSNSKSRYRCTSARIWSGQFYLAHTTHFGCRLN